MRYAALNLAEGWSEEGYVATLTHEGQKAVQELTQDQKRAIQKSSGIPFSRKVSFDTALGALVAGLVLDQVAREDTAIIYTGNQGHVPVSLTFAKRALEFGSSLIDPMQFPAVLPSYAPTAIAAVHGCTGPALTIGFGHSAVNEAICAAKNLVANEFCVRSVILVCSPDNSENSPRSYFAFAAILDDKDEEIAPFVDFISSVTQSSAAIWSRKIF